jgi:hypothetical protein
MAAAVITPVPPVEGVVFSRMAVQPSVSAQPIVPASFCRNGGQHAQVEVSATTRAPVQFPSTHPLAQSRAKRPQPLLSQCNLEFVQEGATASGVSPLYEGPYRVLQAGKKVFLMGVRGRTEAVSSDRLKPHKEAAR